MFDFDEVQHVQLIHQTAIPFFRDKALARDLSFTMDEAKQTVDEQARKYVAVNLLHDSNGQDLFPFSDGMESSDKARALLSYLEAKPLLPYILEHVPGATILVPTRYRYVLLQFLDPSDLEGLFRDACKNGCLNAINSIFQKSSLEMDAPQWYSLERPIIRAALQEAVTLGLVPQIQLLINYLNRRNLRLTEFVTLDKLAQHGFRFDNDSIRALESQEAMIPVLLESYSMIKPHPGQNIDIRTLGQETISYLSSRRYGHRGYSKDHHRKALAINEVITFWYNLGMVAGKLLVAEEKDLQQFLHLIHQAGVKY